MKPKPLIGISSQVDSSRRRRLVLPRKYANRIQEAGGLAVTIPPVESADARALARRLDALVISGGYDIPAHLYGQPPHESLEEVSLDRLESELHLIDQFLAQRKPILGICFGHQVLNFFFGGSFIQDIPSQVSGALDHVGPQKGFRRHDVDLQASALRDLLGYDRISTVSAHHQSVDRVGRGVRVVGTAPDGVIEATEFEVDSQVISIQWHPEEGRDRVSRTIFEATVAAA